MGGNTRKSNGPFNNSSGAKAALPQSDTMALIIDIQGAGNMSEKDAKDYFDKLGRTVEDLRAKNVPVTWVVMNREPKNNLIRPESGSEQRRDLGDLSRMGFGGIDPGEKNRMIFRQFIRDHGPQQNEAIYQKFFKSPFVAPSDYADDHALRTTLENDYGRDKQGKPLVELPDPNTDDPAFTDYLKNERGVKNLVLLGSVSTHCVTAAAISAMKKGFAASIGIDGVLSWEGDEAMVNPRTSKLRWRDGDALQAKDDFHRKKIEERLDKMTEEEKTAWGLSDADIESIKKNITTASEFTAAHAQQTSAPKVANTPAIVPA
jgi:nicotinamidase-related amidase